MEIVSILMIILFTVFVFCPIMSMTISDIATTYFGHIAVGLCYIGGIPILFGIFKGLVWLFELIGSIFVVV